MELTRNFKIFIALNVVSMFAYAWIIINGIGVKQVREAPDTYEVSLLGPLLFIVFWWVSTSLLLKYDNVRGTRRNLNLQYHATMSIIIVGAMAITAILEPSILGFWMIIPLSALGISFLVHWFFTRKTLKGIEAKKVFK